MLSELALTYIVRDEVVKITTPEESENDLDTRLYRVPDFAYEGKPPVLVNRPVSRFELLAHVITTTIAPDSWDSVGGAGDFTPYDAWNVVAISQTEIVHEQIEALLTTLVRARNADPQQPRDALVFPLIKEAEMGAQGRIERALNLEATFDFNEAPLAEVAQFVQGQFEFPVVIDRRALDDVGLGSDTPVTVSLHGISLRSALRLMLKELDLTYVIADEVLKITTPEEAENELAICVYPVHDFMEDASSAGCVGMPARAIALRTLLTASVAPDTWDYVGGAGTAVPVAPWGVLIVSQTTRVQEQVRGLLTAARRARGTHGLPVDRQADPVAPVPGSTPSPFGEPSGETGGDPFAAPNQPVASPMASTAAMLLKRYVLGFGVSTDQASQLLQGTVNGTTWRAPAGIFPVGDALFIRQTEAAHAQIEELLRSAGLSFPVGMGGKGMPIQPQPVQPQPVQPQPAQPMGAAMF